MPDTEQKNKRSFRDYMRIFSCGFLMGSADVVPGVSGGTMAFILNIYDELLESIHAFTGKALFSTVFKFDLKKAWNTLPWPFLLALGLGILSAIAVFSTPIKWMLENRLSLILAFFFGLVLASIISVLNRVKTWGPTRFISLILGAAAGWLIVGMQALADPPSAGWYIVLCGAVAISAMILPGISGSFILLLMGKYGYILDTVNALKKGADLPHNLTVMMLFGIGVVLGIAGFVRILKFLLNKFHDVTIAALIGFMIGSLRKVWPWKAADKIDNANILPQNFDASFWYAVGLAVLGLVIVLAIEFIAAKRETK